MQMSYPHLHYYICNYIDFFFNKNSQLLWDLIILVLLLIKQQLKKLFSSNQSKFILCFNYLYLHFQNSVERNLSLFHLIVKLIILFMINKVGFSENLASHYLFLLSLQNIIYSENVMAKFTQLRKIYGQISGQNKTQCHFYITVVGKKKS